jgi:hypothetical protein
MSKAPEPLPPDCEESRGERMVYLVRSTNPKTPRKVWRVDLLARNGAAECCCPDWGCRRGPAIKAGEMTLTRKTTCCHVRIALAYFCRGLLKALAQSEQPPPSK